MPMSAKPKINGSIFYDDAHLDRYSSDLSHYSIIPRMVAVPRDEDDVKELVSFSKIEGIPLTPRGAGSNQSGSAVGGGIIVLSSDMKDVLRKSGRRARVEPGIVYDVLDKAMRSDGLRLPYDPSSRAFCTIGGNVATRASGIRSIKYGTVDSALRSIRFVDMTHGLVDTEEGLPPQLEEDIVRLRSLLREDSYVSSFLERRGGLKSSSGYNLGAFYRHDDPSEIAAHLLVGSVGTLAIFTSIELEAVDVPPKKVMYLLSYPSLVKAAEAVAGIRSIGPSSLELMDENALKVFKDEHSIEFPAGSRGVLMVEFDEGVDAVDDLMAQHLQKALGYEVERDQDRQEALWGVRESMLLRIIHRMQTPEKRFPSFADDVGVPLDQLAGFVKDLQTILERENTAAVIFGHAGEGNLHVRPMVKLEGWQDSLRRLSDEIFRSTLSHGGTISAEHGLGRNRSMYLRDEWGDRIYEYFKEIKRIFDPSDLLNPGIVFTEDDITNNLRI